MIAAGPSDVPNLWVGFVRTKAMYDMRCKRTTVTAMLATAATASTASELWISGVPVSLICFRRGCWNDEAASGHQVLLALSCELTIVSLHQLILVV